MRINIQKVSVEKVNVVCHRSIGDYSIVSPRRKSDSHRILVVVDGEPVSEFTNREDGMGDAIRFVESLTQTSDVPTSTPHEVEDES